MKNEEYLFVVGLLSLVLAKVSHGALATWAMVATVGFLIAALATIAVRYYAEYQTKKNPPFGVSMQMFFKSPEERSTFTQKVGEVVQEMRRAEDATNGLNEAQLAEAGVAADGSAPEAPAAPAAPAEDATPTVEVGAMYKDNDPRLNRLVKVLSVDGDFAKVVNTLNGYHSTIKVSGLLKSGNRGYTFQGVAND